ncbi:MAG: DUF1934 domain-containing protein [Clostridiaceae bacterium]|nr:DUF1934 domain-containing protein [Clostridiaceae bacterium]
MDNRALISVISRQIGDENPIEVVTPGKFYKMENCYYAVYKETEISGMEGTTTTFKIYPEKFSLIRMGTTTTTMNFEKNNKSMSLYNTPYGMLELEIETKELEINIDGNGGNVTLNYSLYITGQTAIQTLLKIKIEAK